MYKIYQMKRKILNIVRIYVVFVALFMLQKPLFMLYHFSSYRDESLIDWFKVMLYGLKLDCSMAGYLTIIPVKIGRAHV